MNAEKRSPPAAVHTKEETGPAWFNVFFLFVWVLAGVVAFLPFAFDTSPWNAVTLHVPGNQGNWWHALAGAPVFLAYPMIWLRLRSLFSAPPSTSIERRIITCLVTLSIAGTLAVETPFLLHLAGTSQLQRLVVLSLGFGIVIASLAILFVRRRRLAPTQACLIGLDTAWLANASMMLVVYACVPGTAWSRAGWMVTAVIVWPMLLELILLLTRTFQAQPSRISAAAA